MTVDEILDAPTERFIAQQSGQTVRRDVEYVSYMLAHGLFSD
jgi:hypothetical protein